MVGFTTKYEMETYRAAERIAGATSRGACVLVDDSWGNMKAAKAGKSTSKLSLRVVRRPVLTDCLRSQRAGSRCCAAARRETGGTPRCARMRTM